MTNKSEKKQNNLHLLIAFLLIGLAVFLIFLTLRGIFSWYSNQSDEIVAASITFFGTVITGIGAVVASQQIIKSREIAEAHRDKKTDMYDSFVKEMLGFLRSASDNQLGEIDLKKVEDFTYNFNQKVMLWGSPEVLKAYKVFKSGQSSDNILLVVDDIFQEMRKDLGVSNRGLDRGDVIVTMLSDPENLIGEENKQFT